MQQQRLLLSSFLLAASWLLGACGQSTEPAAALAPAAATASPASSSASPALLVSPASLAVGERIYQQSCFACHDSGAAGAPKRGDKAAWAPRLATGQEALYHAALKGLNAMPPRGAAGSASDAEILAAVDYLVAQSR